MRMWWMLASSRQRSAVLAGAALVALALIAALVVVLRPSSGPARGSLVVNTPQPVSGVAGGKVLVPANRTAMSLGLLVDSMRTRSGVLPVLRVSSGALTVGRSRPRVSQGTRVLSVDVSGSWFCLRVAGPDWVGVYVSDRRGAKIVGRSCPAAGTLPADAPWLVQRR